MRLDYVFAPEREAARLRAVRVLTEAPGAAQASDHFPLLVEVER